MENTELGKNKMLLLKIKSLMSHKYPSQSLWKHRSLLLKKKKSNSLQSKHLLMLRQPMRNPSRSGFWRSPSRSKRKRRWKLPSNLKR
jgi:hypothetical protein